MENPRNTQILRNKNEICALIITHNPDEKLPKLVNNLLKQTSEIIIVDNGTEGPSQAVIESITQLPGVSVIENSKNLGIATALNQGMNRAREGGYEWVITFDQDSYPELDLVKKLFSVLNNNPDKSDIIIIAPQIIDAQLQKPALFLRGRFPFIYERVECKESELKGITYVITSGAMVNARIAQEIGDFRDDFFIDYVDTEFCLRARHHKYRILVACEAKIHHHFGDRKHIRWGPIDFFPSFHSPERWFTMSRNRIPMILNYGLKFPHWLSYELVASFYIFLRMLLTEKQRFMKLRAIALGSWDGIRGRMGPPYWVSK